MRNESDTRMQRSPLTPIKIEPQTQNQLHSPSEDLVTEKDELGISVLCTSFTAIIFRHLVQNTHHGHRLTQLRGKYYIDADQSDEEKDPSPGVSQTPIFDADQPYVEKDPFPGVSHTPTLM